MINRKIHTPDGVQDQLFNGCYNKKKLEDNFRKFFISWGYDELETPVMEFYDIYVDENSVFDQESLFKFTDQRGRLLALRPDMTVPTARTAATKMKSLPLPLHCFYIGECFRMNEGGGGRQREFTQAGVELIGVNEPAADAQVISVTIDSLLNAGLDDFCIDLGQVEFFRGLMSAAGIDGSEMEDLRQLINSKNIIGLEKRLKSANADEAIKELILRLPQKFGSVDLIDRIEPLCINEQSRLALENLREIIGILDIYGYGKYISVDLGMVQSLNYYTGLIFKGFTRGVGFPLLGGGRYDNLLEGFGHDVPATGCSINLNMLISAMHNKENSGLCPVTDVFITYDKKRTAEAFSIGRKLRSAGLTVRTDVKSMSEEDVLNYCKEHSILKHLHLSADGIKELDSAAGQVNIYDDEEQLYMEKGMRI